MIRIIDRGICRFKTKPNMLNRLRAYYDYSGEYIFHRCYSDETDRIIFRVFLHDRTCETCTPKMFKRYFKPIKFYRADILKRAVKAFEEVKQEEQFSRTPAELADIFVEVYEQACMEEAEPMQRFNEEAL